MYWKWQCLNPLCNRTFVKPAGYIINLTCYYCHTDLGFLKVAEQKTKTE